jgi:hypothetical protein
VRPESSEHRNGAVEIAEAAVNPEGKWMERVARGLLNPVAGFLRRATHLIHD